MIKENTEMRDAYDIIMDQKKEMICASKVGDIIRFNHGFHYNGYSPMGYQPRVFSSTVIDKRNGNIYVKLHGPDSEEIFVSEYHILELIKSVKG